MLHYRQNKLFTLTEEEFNIADSNDIGEYGKLICQKFNYDTAIILQEINNSKEEFDLMDWKYILEYIMMYIDSSMIESKFESCDQCGNPNSFETYILTTNE
jgi:hypothetical protein